MKEAGLFLSAYVLVFALCFQSLNVNQGRYLLAFLTSFAIGACQIALMRYVPDASWSQMLATLMGGPFAAISAMHVHKHRVEIKRPLLCVIGLHWGDWRAQPNFHSHHAVQIWRCSRCPKIRARTVLVQRRAHPKTDAPPRPVPNAPPDPANH